MPDAGTGWVDAQVRAGGTTARRGGRAGRHGRVARFLGRPDRTVPSEAWPRGLGTLTPSGRALGLLSQAGLSTR